MKQAIVWVLGKRIRVMTESHSIAKENEDGMALVVGHAKMEAHSLGLKETDLVEANHIVPAMTSDEGVVVQATISKKKRG